MILKNNQKKWINKNPVLRYETHRNFTFCNELFLILLNALILLALPNELL